MIVELQDAAFAREDWPRIRGEVGEMTTACRACITFDCVEWMLTRGAPVKSRLHLSIP